MRNVLTGQHTIMQIREKYRNKVSFGITGFQKLQIGSNDREFGRDGLESQKDRRGRWVLLVKLIFSFSLTGDLQKLFKFVSTVTPTASWRIYLKILDPMARILMAWLPSLSRAGMQGWRSYEHY